MSIEIFCDNCGPYFMATNNTTAELDKKTGVMKIKTICPKCKEMNMARAKNLN